MNTGFPSAIGSLNSDSVRPRPWPAHLLIVGCVLLVYANALPAGFVADDSTYLRLAAQPRTIAGLMRVFAAPIRLDPVLAPTETLVYRPAYIAYGVLAHRLWGNRPRAWHGANVAIHGLTACLVLIVLRRLFAMPAPAATLGALLWAVHPVHVQAVTYVAASAYLLMGQFLLLAVLVAAGWWPRTWPWPIRAVAAVGAFCVSVLNHELGLMAPALAGLVLVASPGAGYAWGHRPDRGALAAAGGMGAAAIAYLVLRLALIGTGQAGRLSQTMASLGSRMLQAPEILLRYLGLLAFPARLTLDRTQDVPVPSGILEPRPLIAWALCALLAWAVVRLGSRVALAPVGASWFLLAYLPVSNTLVSLYSVMGEQYIYIASIGGVAGAVAVGHAAARRLGVPRIGACAAVVLVGLLAARTAIRNLDWRDDLSFYRATVAASPRSAYMHNNLGNAYHRRGELDLAERAYRAAVAADPAYPTAYYNLGNLALERGSLNEAEAFYRRALSLRPDSAEVYYNLAVVAHRRGDREEALRLLDRAAALQPARAETHLNLGMALLATDRPRGLEHLRRFLALVPDHPQAPAIRRLVATVPPPTRPPTGAREPGGEADPDRGPGQPDVPVSPAAPGERR